MLKYVDTKVAFSEVPDEISLCINISNCPHKCDGCHSPYLQEDKGIPLNIVVLSTLTELNKGITCVCFMGGDNDIPQLCELADFTHKRLNLKTAWYSGLSFTPTKSDRPSYQVFDFIKTGPYMERYGPLNTPTTNQRFYTKGTSGEFHNTTYKFWKDGSKSQEAES